MKKIFLTLSLVVFLFSFVGCENEPKETPPELTTLFNTKWKLVGFFDIEKNELNEPMAEDCDDCYTLEFMDDSIHTVRVPTGEEKGCYVAWASTVGVSPVIYYTIDYENLSFNIEFMMRTMNVDKLDGERYTHGLYANKFELKGNELKLYYMDNWDEEAPWPLQGHGDTKKPFYLLFKRSDL